MASDGNQSGTAARAPGTLVLADKSSNDERPCSGFGLWRLKQLRKPLTIQLGVPDRARDRAMPEVALDDPDVSSFIHQGITATVPEHMWMDLQMIEAGDSSCLGQHEPDSNARKRFTAFADEERVARLWRIHLGPFGQPGPYSCRFAVINRVWSAVATFEPVNMQLFGIQVDVGKFQRTQLAYPKAVAEHKQQDSVVPCWVAGCFGG